MATPLRIPGEYESGLAKIRVLSNESVRELLAALQQIPDTYSQSSLSSAVAEKVDTIAASDVEEIVPALFSLYAYRDYSQSAISDVAESVAQTMEQSESEQLRLSPEDRDSFTKRLAELLNVEPLNRVARAGILSLENEHTMRDTRIVTDIRPIFEPENPDAPPKGAVIFHTLKINYRADGDRNKEFFVTLDADDVRRLQEQLERAEAKAERLKPIIKAAQMRYIDAK